jgi:hypothetical protein
MATIFDESMIGKTMEECRELNNGSDGYDPETDGDPLVRAAKDREAAYWDQAKKTGRTIHPAKDALAVVLAQLQEC